MHPPMAGWKVNMASQSCRIRHCRGGGLTSVHTEGESSEQGQAITYWNWKDRPLPWDDQLDLNTPRASMAFSDASFDDPILVDLLTGAVMNIAAGSWSITEGAVTFDSLPLYDSPLVIIERELVSLVEDGSR